MINNFKIIAFFIGLFIALPIMADEPSVPSTLEKYINVTVEVHGLDESAKAIKLASQELAKKIDQVELEPDKMTAEQLQALALLMQEANHLLKSFDDSVGQVGPAIEGLRGAANNVVSDTLLSIYQTTIEPTMQSVDQSVSKWLILTFAGIFLLVAIVGYYLYLATKQMRGVAVILKSITEDYEIVPRRPVQVNVEQNK